LVLRDKGAIVAFLDAPSDVDKRGVANRSTSDLTSDLQAAVQHLKKQFPGLPVHLTAFGAGVVSLLESAENISDISHVAVASGDFRNFRTTRWASYKHPVLIIHAPSAQCDYAPYLEAELFAKNNRFNLLNVGYAQQETKYNCTSASQHVFHKTETAFATAVVDWFDGKAPPAVIGHPETKTAWREQILSYQAPAVIGTNNLEMTLLQPDGEGPHPLAIFNHGDIEQESSYIKYKSRYVDKTLAREFLQLGWAVAFPSRAGVGLSEGHYNFKRFLQNDADATYKARINAEDILPAIDYLRTIKYLNPQQYVVLGQSAGGYATQHLASINLPGNVGAINFSGGRTDMSASKAAGYLNSTMVRGFAEYGKTTKIPVLMVFAENDSRYTANTIKASHQAFIEAGGKATLLLSPPIDVDGHFIHTKPDFWRAGLKDYLAQIKETGK
jgi:dienelactone hydrolase